MSQQRFQMNLQFFSGEKTERATPRKRQDSRDKGQVAKSADLPTAIIVFAVFLLLYFIGEWMINLYLFMMKKSFTEYMTMEVTPNFVSMMMKQLSVDALKGLAPILAAAFAAALLSNYAQIGVLFTAEQLKLDIGKLSPLKGAKRMFSMRSVVEMVKSILKVLIIGAIVWSLLNGKKEQIFLLSQQGIGQSAVMIGGLMIQVGLTVGAVLLVLAVADYAYQKYDFEKSIRMSKQDIKDEYKKSEGDPHIKSKIKQKQREMSMSRMMRDVPLADVIITNPTHYAVALKYDPTTMQAPKIIAMGTDFLALKIREVAKEHGIVTMENKPLARALYHQLDIGDYVPEELFKAVAEVLAYVYRIKGRAK